jgi:hypothetical protein
VARRRRSLGSLDTAQVRHLRERIAGATSRLSWQQAGQLAQLAARTGVVWASRAALARMLDIGRRTLDRVLAELAGLVFVVVAVEGRQGGTVLVPIWGRRADAPPLDAEGHAAAIAGYLRRAGALDLSPAAVAAARSLRSAAAVVICATRLPAKALRLLAFALAKLRQLWQRESGAESEDSESSAAATPNEGRVEPVAAPDHGGQQEGASGDAGSIQAADEVADHDAGLAEEPVPPAAPSEPPGSPPAPEVEPQPAAPEPPPGALQDEPQRAGGPRASGAPGPRPAAAAPATEPAHHSIAEQLKELRRYLEAKSREMMRPRW